MNRKILIKHVRLIITIILLQYLTYSINLHSRIQLLVLKSCLRPDGFFSGKTLYTKQGFQAVVFNSSTWIFNRKVMQYSAVASYTRTQVTIEAIISRQIEEQTFNIFFACIASTDHVHFKTQTAHSFKYMNVHYKPFIKVLCVYPRYKLSDLSNLIVSVVFLDEYVNLDENSMTLIFAQRPVLYDLSRPVQPAVINCVHNLRGVDDARYARIVNWIDLNIALGVSKLVFYHSDRNKTNVNKLAERYPTRVELIEYNIDAKRACALFEPHGLRNCLDSYGFLFNDEMVFFHERISSNDCKLCIDFKNKVVRFNVVLS
jgi:hypothetical protein